MNSNIEELTRKVYSEGVEKAKSKGSEIINEAKVKAQDIIKEAEKKAKTIVATAEKKGEEKRIQHEAEIKLSSRQAIAVLKQKITDLIVWEVISEPISGAFQDEKFVEGLVEKLIDYWTTYFGKEERLDILLPEEDYAEVQKTLRGKAQELLQKGVKIEFHGTMKDGFQISPEDGRFKVSFTSDDFENYFKTFARPRTYTLLYGDQS
jgi:V/A-type H+-transporting ATPase subunit E